MTTQNSRHVVRNGHGNPAFERAYFARPEVQAMLSDRIYCAYLNQRSRQQSALRIIDDQAEEITRLSDELEKLRAAGETIARQDVKVTELYSAVHQKDEQITKLSSQLAAAEARAGATEQTLNTIKTLLTNSGYPGHVVQVLARLVQQVKQTERQQRHADLGREREALLALHRADEGDETPARDGSEPAPQSAEHPGEASDRHTEHAPGVPPAPSAQY